MLTKMFRKRKALKVTFVSLVTLLFLFSVGSLIFSKVFYDDYFQRVNQPDYTGLLRYSDVSGYERTKVTFNSGETLLTGYIYGEENQKGLVVISHGLGYGAEDYLAETLYFVDHGWRVFTFDNTGTYESQGQSERGLPQSVIDLDAALTYVESKPALSNLPVMLFGHSWGGYAVAAILNTTHPITAVVSVSGFNSPDDLLLEEAQREMGIFGYLEYPFLAIYQSWLFGDKANLSAVDGINQSETPVMIVHGTADESISYTGASIISRREKITNPNVIYKTCSVENHNGHKSLLRSEAAVKYIDEINQEYQQLFDHYNGNIPDEARARFYGSLDKQQASELDPNLMNDINGFYEGQLH
jgi:pimeloyl-ACP methyl ester carboxylesterase